MKTEHSKVDQQELRAGMMAGRYGKAARLSAAFLTHAAIWHRLATNSEATSCKDASARRWRLGKEGIGLHNELKSIVFAAIDPSGELLVIAHCNGDCELDENRIAATLGLAPGIQVADLSTQLGDMYGSVNPFNFASLLPRTRVKQVFDRALIAQPPESQTMMTNGGHKNIGVEFRVKDVVAALGAAAVVESISQKAAAPVEKMIFVAGGDGYAAFRFAKMVQDRANDAVGIRSGTGLGAIPLEVRIIPGLAVTKAIQDYSGIIADAVSSAVTSDTPANVLIVPCTLGVEAALQSSDRKLNVFQLSECVLAGVDEGVPILGAKNDFDSLALLHHGITAGDRASVDFDFIGNLDHELGVRMASINIAQKMYAAFANGKFFQLNINLWYYMHELSGNRALARLGPNIKHLHDVAAHDLALRFLKSRMSDTISRPLSPPLS